MIQNSLNTSLFSLSFHNRFEDAFKSIPNITSLNIAQSNSRPILLRDSTEPKQSYQRIRLLTTTSTNNDASSSTLQSNNLLGYRQPRSVSAY